MLVFLRTSPKARRRFCQRKRRRSKWFAHDRRDRALLNKAFARCVMERPGPVTHRRLLMHARQTIRPLAARVRRSGAFLFPDLLRPRCSRRRVIISLLPHGARSFYPSAGH